MLYFLSGLVAALAADIHLNGIILPATLAVVLAYRSGIKIFLRKEGIAFLVGVFEGLIWWYFLHIQPDPSLFFTQWKGFWKSQLPVTHLVSSPTKPFFDELGRYLNITRVHKATFGSVIAFSIAFIFLLIRGIGKSEKTLLVLILSFFVLMALFVSNKTPTYVVLIFPYILTFLPLVAFRSGDRLVKQRFRITCLYLFLVASILAQSAVFYRFWNADYDSFIAKLKQHIPEGTRLQGQPTYWFGFYDHPYWADHYFGRLKKNYPQNIRRLKIEYIIADEFFLNVMKDKGAYNEKEVKDFLEKECELVATVKDPYYGKGYGGKKYNITRIYRVIY